MKKLKITFWLSVICMFLMSSSFLIMPMASDKALDGENWWFILSGSLFWIPLLAGYLLLYLTDRWRRKSDYYRQSPRGVKYWGVFRIMSNTYAFFADTVFVLGLIGFLAFYFANPEHYGIYVFLCLTVFAFHMHCMFNGVNYKTIFGKKHNHKEWRV